MPDAKTGPPNTPRVHYATAHNVILGTIVLEVRAKSRNQATRHFRQYIEKHLELSTIGDIKGLRYRLAEKSMKTCHDGEETKPAGCACTDEGTENEMVQEVSQEKARELDIPVTKGDIIRKAMRERNIQMTEATRETK